MGNKQTLFNEEEIQNYLDTTFLNRKEFLRITKRFLELYNKRVGNMSSQELKGIVLGFPELTGCPELKENPFRKRICKVFSKNGCGDLQFDEFVQMFSCLSSKSPRELKLHYAFSIYDIDGDGYIGNQDIEQVVQLLTQGELQSAELASVCAQVLEEADFDDDERLSKNEFTHIVDKSPDFITTFNIRI